MDTFDKEILENKHVHSVYSEIAPQLSKLSYKPWPRIKSFIRNLQKNSLVLDVGCGSGNYMDISSESMFIGCDICPELIEIAAKNGHESLVCDNLSLPFANDFFDVCISISVIHHFSSEHRRAKALSEIARIVKPGGQIFVCVWAMEQAHRKFHSQDVLIPCERLPTTNSAIDVQRASDSACSLQPESFQATENNSTSESKILRHMISISNRFLSPQNAKVTEEFILAKQASLNIANDLPPPKSDNWTRTQSLESRSFNNQSIKKWENNDPLFKDLIEDCDSEQRRYYHVFRAGELDDLIKDYLPNLIITSSYFDHGNWCVIAKKSP